MIPVGVDVALRGTPGAVLGLLVANLMVFAMQVGLPPELGEAFIYQNGLVPARYTAPETVTAFIFESVSYAPFFTNIFMHAGLVHLVVNMWVLWLFGRAVEDRLGAPRFILLYLACGLVAGLTHFVFNLASTVPALGASGAVAGLIGAFAVLHPRARVILVWPAFYLPFVRTVPAAWFAGLWFAFQFLAGLVDLARPDEAGGIAWWAHVGGFVPGLLLAILLAPTPAARRPAQDSPYVRSGPRDVGPQRPRRVDFGPDRAPGRQRPPTGSIAPRTRRQADQARPRPSRRGPTGELESKASRLVEAAATDPAASAAPPPDPPAAAGAGRRGPWG